MKIQHLFVIPLLLALFFCGWWIAIKVFGLNHSFTDHQMNALLVSGLLSFVIAFMIRATD